MRAYPIWAIILLVLGWAIIAATLAIMVDILFPFDAFGVEFLFAMVGSVGIFGIAAGLALIAIAGAGRRDGKRGRWKLWAKLLLLLGGAVCISISLLMFAGNELHSMFVIVIFAYGWIPLLFGALLILAALIWGRRAPGPASDVVA